VEEYVGAMTLLLVVIAAIAGLYAVGLLAAVHRDPLRAAPFSGGLLPGEHPLSRSHALRRRRRGRPDRGVPLGGEGLRPYAVVLGLATARVAACAPARLVLPGAMARDDRP
jgi:hypothetical protein